MHKLEADDAIANGITVGKEGLFIGNERDKHKVDTENKEKPT